MAESIITYEFVDGILYAEATDELHFDDIINHYQVLFTDVEFAVGIPALYDFSKVSHIEGKMEDFEKIAKDMGDKDIITSKAHVAIVVDSANDTVANVFNAYSQMMDYTQMDVKVFYSKESALTWLGNWC